MLKRNSDPNSTRTRTDDGDDDDRTERGSVWDVPVEWREKFWVIFSMLMLAAAAFETWFDFEYGTAPTALHRFRAIIWSTVQYMAPAAPIAIFLTEGIRVLSEKYLRKRFRDGLNEGDQRGEKRGVRIGREQTRQEFLDWLERRDAATAAGIPFDEPPPGVEASESRSVNGNGATAQPVNTGNGTHSHHLSELEAWYVRRGIAEDMGVPFNEPHPIRSNGNGTV